MAIGSLAVDLSDREITDRLESYLDPRVTDELYEFGSMMLQDSVARIGKMDSKAAALAAYSGGLITVLVATRDMWSKLHYAQVDLIYLGAGLLLLAAAAAIRSMYLQDTEWFTQNEWLKADCLQTHEAIRRYHVLTMCGIVRSHHQAYRRKLLKIYAAQFALIAAGVVLFVALV